MGRLIRRILLLVLLLAGTAVSAGVQTVGGVGNTSMGGANVDHVVVIVMENQPLDHVYGDGCAASCSYITQLAGTFGFALNYSGVAHDSLPNYLTLTSGGNYSVAPFYQDCFPTNSTCTVRGKNLMDSIEQSGRTWRAYMEDYSMLGGCRLSDASGGRSFNSTDLRTMYDTNHNPFVYYTDIAGNMTRCGNVVDANGQFTGYFAGPNGGSPTALLADLNGQSPPNLMWLTPNRCNDGHDNGTAECPVKDPVAEQSNYLEMLVPQILDSTTFRTNDSALYIVWDEGGNCSAPGQTFPACSDPVAAIWAGFTIRLGYESTTGYSHYSFVTTLESLWNLNALPIPNGINAQPMLDFFSTGTVAGVTLPIDKIRLLAPYVAVVLALVVAVLVSRRWRAGLLGRSVAGRLAGQMGRGLEGPYYLLRVYA